MCVNVRVYTCETNSTTTTTSSITIIIIITITIVIIVGGYPKIRIRSPNIKEREHGKLVQTQQ
jgi:hypothetical protein